MPHTHETKLKLTHGDHGLRFAGPDLLDDYMIFEITGGLYHGHRIRIDSSYHPCCGTLEISASLFNIYKHWHNKLDGCRQHTREGGGDKELRRLVMQLHCLVHKAN